MEGNVTDHKSSDGLTSSKVDRRRPRPPEAPLDGAINRAINDETGAIGYIVLWLLGVPAGLLFVVFLMRGCT